MNANELTYLTTDKDRVLLSFFRNTVVWSEDEKSIYINVPDAFEYRHCLHYENCPVPEKMDRDEYLKYREELDRKRDVFRGKIGIKGYDVWDNTDEGGYPRAWLMSNTDTKVPLGEGIRNFIEADFESIIKTSPPDISSHSFPGKAGADIMEKASVMGQYTADKLKDIINASLYTALFPPCILEYNGYTVQFYLDGLSALHTYFRELMTFVFDAEYEKEILGRLEPHRRYLLWCRMHRTAPGIERIEKTDPSALRLSGPILPGTDIEKELHSRPLKNSLSEKEKAWAKAHGIDERAMLFAYRIPCTVRTSYTCSSLREMLFFEFSKMLECC